MQRRFPPVLAAGCLALLTVSSFQAVLFEGHQFGFRDAVQYFDPLHRAIQAQWNAGRFPLWLPAENAGMPLLGNPTAAVLYPGKIVFALLPDHWAARIYVIGHTLLAFAGMVALARGLGRSHTAALISGLAYAFGAPTLFLYSNVIYLVGASWLPFGIRAAERLVRTGETGAFVELAGVLVMSTLGGDPEAAYLCGVAGLLYIPISQRVPSDEDGPARWRTATALVAVIAAAGALGLAIDWSEVVSQPAFRIVRLAAWVAVAGVIGARARVGAPCAATAARRVLALAGAGVLAACLAGVQLVPAAEFASLSFRAAEQAPLDIFRFSIHPVRLIELAWPNVTGATFPENHSWLVLLEPGAAQQFWVPSLYLGGLTLVLALAGAGLGRGPAGRVWLTVLAIVALLGSLGRLGGIYAVLAALLPGFGMFRYPSKLLVLASLAPAGLAGYGWDRVAGRSPGRSALAWSLALLAAGLIALGSIGAARGAILDARDDAPQASSLAGPLDLPGALADARRGLIHGGLVFLAAAVLLRLARKRPAIAGSLAIGLMTIDLLIANRGLVWTVPRGDLEGPPEAVERIDRAERDGPARGPFRVFRMPSWYPLRFHATRSPSRIRELVRFERDTQQPSYGLTTGPGQAFSPGVLELYDYLWFFRPLRLRAERSAAAALGVRPGSPVLYYPRKGVDIWASRYLILPARPDGWTGEARGYAAFLERTTPLHPDPATFEGPGGAARRLRWETDHDWQLVRNDAAFPRAWVVHDARVIEPLRWGDDGGRSRVMQRLLFPNDLLWHDDARPVLDLRATALVELDDPGALAGQLPRTPPAATESVRFVRDEPTLVELDATLDRPGLVILADVLYPGWTLAIDGEPATILRVNRMMRGAVMKAGRHRLVYRYEPTSLKIGLALTATGLAACAILAVRSRRLAARGRGV
jgi:hypothetical protein